jgi:hypothetical protein
MFLVCRITEATNTHSYYLILIAFARQKWLREGVSALRYTYIACLVYITVRYAVWKWWEFKICCSYDGKNLKTILKKYVHF